MDPRGALVTVPCPWFANEHHHPKLSGAVNDETASTLTTNAREHGTKTSQATDSSETPSRCGNLRCEIRGMPGFHSRRRDRRRLRRAAILGSLVGAVVLIVVLILSHQAANRRPDGSEGAGARSGDADLGKVSTADRHAIDATLDPFDAGRSGGQVDGHGLEPRRHKLKASSTLADWRAGNSPIRGIPSSKDVPVPGGRSRPAKVRRLQPARPRAAVVPLGDIRLLGRDGEANDQWLVNRI